MNIDINKKYLIILFLFSVFGKVFSQPVNLSGRVVSLANNQPISRAIIQLTNLGISDTTDQNGRFLFSSTPILKKSMDKEIGSITKLNKSILIKTNLTITNVEFSLLSSSGKSVFQYKKTYSAGNHILDINELISKKNPTGILFLKVYMGEIEKTFVYNSLSKLLTEFKGSTENLKSIHNPLIKKASRNVDVLDVRAWGYRGKEIPIGVLTQGDLGTISLGQMDELSIVPIPQKITQGVRAIKLTPQSKLVYSGPSLKDLIPITISEIQSVTGLQISTSNGSSKPGDIHLHLNPNLSKEQYHIEIYDKIEISGGSYSAVALGTTTLLQLMESNGEIPSVTINDWPENNYRALMIDIARTYHSLSTMRQIIRMARLYKINFLHLHIIDDGAYSMFPFKAFPKIHQGQSGDKGPKPPYTIEEWKELIKYAQDRGITIIPEFETPGHSGQIIKAYPEIFSLNTGENTCQNYAKPEVRQSIKLIINELAEVFTNSPYIHLGGDEARFWSSWETPEFQKAFADLNLPQPYTMQHSLYVMNDFLAELNGYVKEVGKTMVVWEGFQRKYDSLIQVPRDVIVMPFDSWKHTPWELVEDGFDIISATWIPNYIVDTNFSWSPQEIYQWDKFYFEHWYKGSHALGGKRVDPKYDQQIIGASMCSWATREELEIPLIRPRLPAFSEKIWNSESGKTYENFNTRFLHTDNVLSKILQ